jgi:hypothetical protein
MKALVLTLALSLLSGSAFACQFNTDCAVGSKCMKESGKLEGICMGGMNPGNNNDRKPYGQRGYGSSNENTGNTCSFDTECGIGAKCYKSGIKGVCGPR